jgi:hypothetical protein
MKYRAVVLIPTTINFTADPSHVSAELRAVVKTLSSLEAYPAVLCEAVPLEVDDTPPEAA